MRLKGKVAIVTGGSRGIGHAAVRKFAVEGAAVGFSYFTSEKLAHELERAIRDRGGQAVAVRADVRSRPEVERFVEQTVSVFGGIDVVVNNAHQAYVGKYFEDSTWEEFQRELDTLVRGPFNVIQSVLPYLKQRGGGAIVNVGSTMARAPRLQHSFYVTAKAALWGMTQALAIELGRYGIRVNMVTPGPLETDHNATYPPEVMAKLAAETPLYGRLGTTEQVADAIVMLALDEARFVTGADVLASGGFSIA
ncbi:MAG: SDR family oxidoreductase [Candidatus Rokubacteria bacterium]|nr:SDR family oxidoreductase [Candidatus Rokubacteria bacterium]